MPSFADDISKTDVELVPVPSDQLVIPASSDAGLAAESSAKKIVLCVVLSNQYQKEVDACRKGMEAIETFNSESEENNSVAGKSLLRTSKFRAYCVDLWLAKDLDAIQVIVVFMKALAVDPRVVEQFDKITAEAKKC